MEDNAAGKDKSDEKRPKREYDLAERTARFAENIVDFANRMPRTPVTIPLITQLVKAGTSVGANDREADESVSVREFRNKVGYCKKEASETKYWLRVIAKAVPKMKDEARGLWQEANELHLIFSASFRTASRRMEAEQAQRQARRRPRQSSVDMEEA
jgi:four helix bundle protein